MQKGFAVFEILDKQDIKNPKNQNILKSNKKYRSFHDQKHDDLW